MVTDDRYRTRAVMTAVISLLSDTKKWLNALLGTVKDIESLQKHAVLTTARRATTLALLSLPAACPCLPSGETPFSWAIHGDERTPTLARCATAKRELGPLASTRTNHASRGVRFVNDWRPTRLDARLPPKIRSSLPGAGLQERASRFHMGSSNAQRGGTPLVTVAQSSRNTS